MFVRKLRLSEPKLRFKNYLAFIELFFTRG